jgi:uncharacterized membrane protein YfcA
MIKFKHLVKENLLAIAVTLAVLSFLCDCFILHYSNFILTKIFGSLMFVAAIYTRNKENSAFQAHRKEKLQKTENTTSSDNKHIV